MERFEGGVWRRVHPAERHLLGASDAQAWLLLSNLLLDPACAARADTSEGRIEALQEVRQRLTPQLVEHLPVLRSLQRAIEELTLGASRRGDAQWAMGKSREEGAARVLIEQAPALRAQLVRCTDWGALAEQQKNNQFLPGATSLTAERARALLHGFDFLCGLESEDDVPWRGLPRTATLEAYCLTDSGRWVWHGTYRLELRTDQGHESVTAPDPKGGCDMTISQSRRWGKTEQAEAHAGQDDTVVTGKRYRLAPLEDVLTKALPSKGKLVLTYCSVTCEAALQLPAPDSRCELG